MKDINDTICALSTPPGRSGIALVRVSGPEALALFRRVFASKNSKESIPFRQAVLGRILDPRGAGEIDEAVACCFQAGRSYTGEDMCEFSLHGNPVIARAFLDCLCSLGARIAEPGEFTMRAFLHGRMDLTQAEAVRDIIEATTLYQAQVAARQRSGFVGQQVRQVKELLIDVIVDLESAVEFSEEGLEGASLESVVRRLEAARQRLRGWVDSYRQGKVIREGFSLAIVGKRNVGKSSLFNAILTQDRSIVTEIPGTTRDLVSETTSVDGIPFRLVDTAGIGPSDNLVENLGMDRSRQAIADADAILLVSDGSRPLEEEDIALRRELEGLMGFSVINKSDLPSCWSGEEKERFSGSWPWMEVSAKTMSGIEELRKKILDGVCGPVGANPDGMILTNLRHCRSLEAVEDDLAQAVRALAHDGLSEEFALTDLHRALRGLGEVTGETGVEDLLTEIFSRFCIGK